jgi:DMSO/TMAO reductase YedYZ molybdopterin-dependent catalytic subunit
MSAGKPVDDVAARTPPGQVLTEKWPVLHYGDVPKVTPETFRLRVFGLVERPLELGFAELQALPSVRVTSDFHCVTTWSRLDNHWEGVRFATLAAHAGAKPEAQHAMLYGSDGYTTNVPLSWLADTDVLIAWSHDGAPLAPEHGGPVRMVVPKLYAWKSAKWLSGVEFLKDNRRGFWEERGYHNRGEPFAEERYSYQETE